MAAPWQQRMAELVSDDWMRPVMERLAEGGPVDEGEKATDWEGLHPVMNRYAENRDACVKWNDGARIWLIEHPPKDMAGTPLSQFAIEQVRAARAIKDENERRRALQTIARNYYSAAWVPPVGVTYQPDGDARDLGAEDFYTEVVQGAARLVEQGWSRHRYPELEYMRQKAEAQSGWRRADKTDCAERSIQEIEFERLYNAFERRYRYQDDKRRTQTKKQRETTPPVPV